MFAPMPTPEYSTHRTCKARKGVVKPKRTGFLTQGVASKLARGGAPELKTRYPPGLLSGELIDSPAVSEPSVGSHVHGIKTRAVRDGDN